MSASSPSSPDGLVSGDLLAAEPAVLTGALIGYARVSTAGQLLDRQLRALTEAGCSRVFSDQLSGRTAERPELTRCLDYLRPGDTLVVPSLDRLSRSLQDLINLVGDLRRAGVGFRSLHEALDTTTPGGRLVFHVFAALAEFIRELIVEGTREGLDAARARGTRLGRPRALTSEQVAHARDLLANPKTSVASIARLLGVSRSTIYAALPELAGARGALRTSPRPAALPAAQDDYVDQAATIPAPSAAPTTELGDQGDDVDQDVDQAGDEVVPEVRSDARTAKARAVWGGLNDRQRAYLEVIYQADQAQESWIATCAARGERSPSASVWRWLPYNAADAWIRAELARRRVVDPGAGSTLKALAVRGLVLTRDIPAGLGELVVEVRLTTLGRAVARAGLGVARSSRPKGLLSQGLWRQLVMAVRAELAGKPLDCLWRQTHLYLGTGYALRGRPSRGYLVERGEPGVPYSSRWYLTDVGRAHLVEHLDAYRQTYPRRRRHRPAAGPGTR